MSTHFANGIPSTSPTSATVSTKGTYPIDKKAGAQVINPVLMGSLFKKHRVLLMILCVCVAGYTLMMLALWPLMNDPRLLEFMEQLASSMAGVMDMSALRMTAGQYIETQWLGAYWLPLAGALMIVVAARAIAGSVADGSLEILCSTPLKRSTYLVTVVAVILAMSLVISIAGIAPLAIFGPLFDMEIAFGPVALLTLTTFLITFVFGLMVLAISSWTRGIALPAGIAVGIMLVLIVLLMVIPNVEALEFLQPISLLYQWAPGALIDEGHIRYGLWIWLAVVGTASLVLSWLGFMRRDLT